MNQEKQGIILIGSAFVIWFIFLIFVPWRCAFPEIPIVIYLGALLGMALLFAGLGVGIAGPLWGILQDARNIYSLSRLQMALWTWLILSALMAMAACHGWKVDAPNGAAGFGLLDIGIPNNLYYVMGISFFTTAAAPAVLALKSQADSSSAQVNAATARMGEPVFFTGQILNRPASADPSLLDIVRGDDVATAGTVDLSKVQQLVITLLLVVCYGVLLLQLFAHAPFQSVVVDNTPVTSLPDFPANFVTLLALSHGGYLAYKAAPRSAPTAAPPLQQPPSPDPLAMTP